MLATLLELSAREDTVVTRGGLYNPELNVWIADGFAEMAAQSSPATRQVLDALAALALAAGKLHRQQLNDANSGKIWPSVWQHAEGSEEALRFCSTHPESASPYVCIDQDHGGAIPYTHAYQAELKMVSEALDNILALGGDDVQPLRPYLEALRQAFAYEPGRVSELEAMGQADVAWLEIAGDARWLLISEFTETYADPLKHHIGHHPTVNAWAKEVSERNGMGPWKTFFEFRLLELLDSVVTTTEIESIRKTIRELYAGASDSQPSAKARTEFRRALINAGHGAFPPKSAKNYPNQAWIRRDYGYRNVIFANQVEEKVRGEMTPALQAAFDTEWSRHPNLADQLLRSNALFIVAHEETHPWVVFNELTWLEELKCNVLGMFALFHSPAVEEEIANIVLSVVAGALQLHRQQQVLVARGEMQLQDYYIGDILLMTHLADGGYFVFDGEGMAVDVRGELAAPLLERFVQRILAMKRGEESASSLLADLHRGGEVFTRFRG
jgi:hypothetical protein